MRLETLAVHAGYRPDPTTEAVAAPICQTTSEAFDNAPHGAGRFNLKLAGNTDTPIMNPTIDALAQVAHAAAAPLIVDNTAATPDLLRPLEHAADIVVRSQTQSQSGHGSSVGGAIVDGGRFPRAYRS